MIEGEADSVTITSPHIETDDVRLKQASIKLYPDFLIGYIAVQSSIAMVVLMF